MIATPWEIGSIPTSCPKCGAVLWAKAPWEIDLKCCGERVRLTGGDNRQYLWRARLCKDVREAHAASVIDAIKRVT